MQVGLAMSGGVDSTSCALMLKDHYNVTGFFMQLAQPDLSQQLRHVHELADRVGIPLKVIDLSEQFTISVLDYFSSSYFCGLTPNPCMICNKKIKFGLFLKEILDAGMEKIATGHYARVKEENGAYHLLQGKDEKKDQSYFLSRLEQSQLSKILFPLGGMKKSEVYQYVEEAGFKTFRGKESQDVCFLAEQGVGEFLRTRYPQKGKPGALRSIDGKILGSHKGLHHYTIGQRRGLGISDETPYYVIKLDAADNSVIVGKNADLLQDSITINNLNWLLGSPPVMDSNYLVKIRYSHKGSLARLRKIDDNHCQLKFHSQQRAITPGQFAVIYLNDEVLGSGQIC